MAGWGGVWRPRDPQPLDGQLPRSGGSKPGRLEEVVGRALYKPGLSALPPIAVVPGDGWWHRFLSLLVPLLPPSPSDPQPPSGRSVRFPVADDVFGADWRPRPTGDGPGPTVVGLASTVGLAVAGQLWIYSWPGYGWPDIYRTPCSLTSLAGDDLGGANRVPHSSHLTTLLNVPSA